jgi:3D (Asp-Asp-Asp) domain-containing protein
MVAPGIPTEAASQEVPMYRPNSSILRYALTLAIVLTASCGRPDKGIPAEPPVSAPVIVEAVVDLRVPPPEVEQVPALPEPNLTAGLGDFKMTYYWVATEDKGARGTQRIVDKTCKPVARVTKSFKRRLALEGSGKLKDGRMVTIACGCKCGGTCYWVASEDHRWGSGVKNRPLKPFRSVAVDPKQVKIGSSLYVAELDGLTMPGAGDEGGFVHDGCVIADDRGGGVRGKQIDFFAARRGHYKNFFKRHKIGKVSVYQGGDRCSPELREDPALLAASRGSI